MYIFKNALTSITRNKGRNILIGIIIVVISIASTITLAIMNSATKLVNAYKEANPLVASINMNRGQVMGLFKRGEDNQEDNIASFNNVKELTLDEINKYGDSKYLTSYYYTYTTSLDSDTLEKATDSISKEIVDTQTSTTTSGKGFPGGNMPSRDTTTIITKRNEIFQNNRLQTGDFSLIGYSSYGAMEEFIGGTYKISDGKLFSDFESFACVINNELATLNEIEVGDKITLKNSNNNKTYDFVVNGIYEEKESNNTNNMYSNSVNNIIVSSNIVEKILGDDDSLKGSIIPSYVLNNENAIDLFTKEVEEKGLSEYYQVTTNLENIANETKSINNVKTFAKTFLIITLSIGGIVLLVINMINVRERKYEIGVLRTIGMKKSLVISQFVIELLLVSVVSLSLGALIGSFTSVKTANYLLSEEISSASESKQNIDNNFGGMGMNKGNNNFMGIAAVDKVTSINAVVNAKVISELLLVGIILTLISSLSSMISIQRFSPLTILKERS